MTKAEGQVEGPSLAHKFTLSSCPVGREKKENESINRQKCVPLDKSVNGHQFQTFLV